MCFLTFCTGYLNLHREDHVKKVLELLDQSDCDFSDDDENDDATWQPAIEESTGSSESEDENVDAPVAQEQDIIGEPSNVFNNLNHMSPSGQDQRRAIWKNVPFEKRSLPIQSTCQNEIAVKTPMSYFAKYFPEEHFQDACFFTKMYALQTHGNILPIKSSHIKKLYGCHILMGCIKYPRVRMYWAEGYAIEIIQNSLSRDLFFMLRNNLHFVDTNQPSVSNKFWRIQPVINCVRKRCRELSTDVTEYSIDEQMIPFTGRAPMRQYVKNKPRPVGLKNFVVAKSSGLIVDFEIYQGANTFTDTGLGLGPSIVIRLASVIPNGSFLYFDRYFTTVALMERLLQMGYKATGTIMMNRLKGINFPLDKNMNRGDISQFVRNDIVALKWRDSRCVTLVSTECGKDPIGTVDRWCKKERKHISVPYPEIVRRYNSNMGGVDVADQSMEYYRIFIKTKKWTVKAVFHMVDMAICNSWREYREDAEKSQMQKKDIKDLFKFKLEIGEALARSTDIALPLPLPEDNLALPIYPPVKKYRPTNPPVDIRCDRYDHWPESVDLTTPRMCREKECSSRTRTKCIKCNVFLCIAKGKSCFKSYHTKH